MAEEIKNEQQTTELPKVEMPKEEPKPTQPSVEEQLAQLRVENAKLKKAFNKSASETADWKKKYNATLSESEQLKQAEAEKQAEREEQFNALLKENTVNKFAKNFLALGYPEELAEKAANAQYENDTDSLFKIQSDFQTALLKAKEAEWLKNRPAPSLGVDGDFTISKEDFNKMGYLERAELAAEHPEVYKKLAK